MTKFLAVAGSIVVALIVAISGQAQAQIGSGVADSGKGKSQMGLNVADLGKGKAPIGKGKGKAPLPAIVTKG